MKFDLVGIVIMIIAIAVGQYVSAYLGGLFGIAGGFVGSLLTGAIVYLIYTLCCSGGKLGATNAVLFIVLLYIAQFASAYVASAVGVASGWLTLILTGIIVSFALGYIGEKRNSGQGLKQKSKL